MKTQYLLLIALLFSLSTSAQYYEPEKKQNQKSVKASEKPFKDRIHFGGNVGLEFSNVGSLILLSPVALYDVSNEFKVGLGLNYIYMNQDFGGIDYSTSIYGGKLLAIYSPIKNVILNTEFEHNYIDRDFSYGSYEIAPYWQSAWFVGAGYAVPMGRKGSLIISMSYDLLYLDNRSYYTSPWRPMIGFYF